MGKKSNGSEKTKKILKYSVVGFMVFSMIFSVFIYLFYAIQNV